VSFSQDNLYRSQTSLDAPPEISRAPLSDESTPWSRNLLHSFEELLEHLGGSRPPLIEPNRNNILDLCMTLSALWQVLEDYLHRGFLGVGGKFRGAIRPEPGQPAPARFVQAALRSPLAALVSGGADRLAEGVVMSRIALSESRLVRVSELLAEAAQDAARLLARSGNRGPLDRSLSGRVNAAISELLAEPFPRRLLRRVMRLPSCFKDFDCHPDDCRTLAGMVSASLGDRRVPLTVVGLRTSGSYLAPLCAAFLRAEGFSDVSVESMRPGVLLFPGERTRLARGGTRGLLLLIDDPPFTGDALLSSVAALERLGVPGTRIVALVLGEPDAPFFRTLPGASSSGWEKLKTIAGAHLLLKDRWRIGTMAGTQCDLKGGAPVFQRARRHLRLRLEPSSIPQATGSGSTPAAASQGASGSTAYVARGSGIGWFGEHPLEIAVRLKEFTPPARPFAEGLFIRPWIEGRTAAEHPSACDERYVRHAARYVAERTRALSVSGRPFTDLEDRKTGWHLLARTFGKSYTALRSLSYYALRKKLSEVSRGAPRAVVDGRMGPSEWIIPDGGGDPVKIDFDEHAFDRSDLSIFDPVLDLAGFSIGHRLSPRLEETLLRTYAALTGDERAPERMPVYKMMTCLARHAELRSQGFEGDADPRSVTVEMLELERTLSNTANGYLAAACRIGDFEGTSGRFVAIDIDGVLEDSLLGFTSTTPAGIRAVRKLHAHDFRPVLATGRSLGEVRERCRLLGLCGGIAEYGSVVWEAERGAETVLASKAELAELETLRTILAGEADLHIDPAYGFSVRVFQSVKGSRRGVPASRIEHLLRQHTLGELRIIPGNDQTDIVGKRIDKGVGLQYLRQAFGATEVHAVGDSMEDLPLFRAADRCYAPANAVPGLAEAMGRGGLQVTRAKRERGLREAARRIVHRGLGRCGRCAEPRDGERGTSALLEALGLRDRGRLRKAFDVINRDMFKNFYASL
jgi:hydroxymethylpyrimidine pyrophosphatase-like HAD family hydrolase